MLLHRTLCRWGLTDRSVCVSVARGKDASDTGEAGVVWAEAGAVRQAAGDGGGVEAEDGGPYPGEGTGRLLRSSLGVSIPLSVSRALIHSHNPSSVRKKAPFLYCLRGKLSFVILQATWWTFVFLLMSLEFYYIQLPINRDTSQDKIIITSWCFWNML